MSSRTKAVLDIECYTNYFLVAIKSMANDKVVTFERSDWSDFDAEQLNSVLRKYTIITFNGNKYDLLLLKGSIAGFDAAKLKVMSDDIIVNNVRAWDTESKYNLPQCKYIDHIDLIDVMINLQTTGYHSSKIISGGLIIFCLASCLTIGFL